MHTRAGSGNTWLRFLIEGATGFFTSSVYMDKNLYKAGFLGEKLVGAEGSTVVTKSHMGSFLKGHVDMRMMAVAKFKGRGVVVIRNPFDVSLYLELTLYL